MGNLRKPIREYVGALLKGKTSAGDRVFETRVRPLWSEELPGIAVYTENEDVSVFEEPRVYRRTLSLVVEIYAEANEALDDTLDLISGGVEDTIDADPTLGGLVNDARETNTTINLVDDGKVIVGSAKLTFQVEYFTNTPDGVAVDFTGTLTKWDTKRDNGQFEATDTTELGNL